MSGGRVGSSSGARRRAWRRCREPRRRSRGRARRRRGECLAGLPRLRRSSRSASGPGPRRSPRASTPPASSRIGTGGSIPARSGSLRFPPDRRRRVSRSSRVLTPPAKRAGPLYVSSAASPARRRRRTRPDAARRPSGSSYRSLDSKWRGVRSVAPRSRSLPRARSRSSHGSLTSTSSRRRAGSPSSRNHGSSLRAISCARLPSTRPRCLAISSFMSSPTSFAEEKPFSEMIARTVSSSSASGIACGR